MRERAERFSILPFSIGCVSESSVDVITPKKSNSEPNPSPPSEEGDEKTKGSNIAERLQKIMRGFKSLPQVFQLQGEEDDEEEEEIEMEIGIPTDVQHVGHIGWDGSNSTVPSMKMKSWNRTPELLSFPSLSLAQFELAIAKEAAAAAAAATM